MQFALTELFFLFAQLSIDFYLFARVFPLESKQKHEMTILRPQIRVFYHL